MSGKERFTAKDMIEALKKTKGMVYLAAKELGCSHTTVYNYIKRYASVRQEYEYQREYGLNHRLCERLRDI